MTIYLCTHCYKIINDFNNPLGLCKHCCRFPKTDEDGYTKTLTLRNVTKYLGKARKGLTAALAYNNVGSSRKYGRWVAKWGNILLNVKAEINESANVTTYI